MTREQAEIVAKAFGFATDFNWQWTKDRLLGFGYKPENVVEAFQELHKIAGMPESVLTVEDFEG